MRKIFSWADCGHESRTLRVAIGLTLAGSSLAFADSWNSGTNNVNVGSTTKVGIGISNPDKQVQVYGNDAEIRIHDPRTTGGNASLGLQSEGQVGRFKFYYGDRIAIDDAGSTEYVTIKRTGNVGIGTISPSFRLDVNGSARMSGNLDVTNNLTVGNSADQTDHFITMNSPAGQYRILRFQSAGSPRWQFRVTNGAEGSNANADLEMVAHADNGSVIDVPFHITRAAGGAINLSRPVSIGGRLTLRSSTSSLPSSDTYPQIYATEEGGPAPFNLNGHLVLQARSGGTSGRDIIFYSGTSPTIRYRLNPSGMHEFSSPVTMTSTLAVGGAFTTAAGFVSGSDDALIRTVATGHTAIAGGTGSNSGANILLYGPSHASLANNWVIRHGSTTDMAYNGSAINITPAVTMASTLAVTGAITSTAAASGTGSSFVANSTNPTNTWIDSDGGSNEKNWDVQANAGTFTFRTRTDANTSGQSWLTATRLGTTVTGVDFSSPVSMSSTLAVAGGISSGTDIAVSKSAPSASASLSVTNTDNSSATSHARLHVTAGGPTGGDAFTRYTINGVFNWSAGIDNDDGDSYVITPATYPGGAPNGLRISTSGAVTMPGTLQVTGTGTFGGSNGFTVGNLPNSQRISYGTDASGSFSLLTATNGWAGLYLNTLNTAGNVTIAGEKLNLNGSNGIISAKNSIRMNFDSDNNQTGESFIIGNNMEAMDLTNNVLFKVQEDGKVGIGQPNPGSQLHISKTVANANSDALALENETSGGQGPILKFRSRDAGDVTRDMGQIIGERDFTGSGSDVGGSLKFLTRNPQGNMALGMSLNRMGDARVMGSMGASRFYTNPGYTSAMINAEASGTRYFELRDVGTVMASIDPPSLGNKAYFAQKMGIGATEPAAPLHVRFTANNENSNDENNWMYLERSAVGTDPAFSIGYRMEEGQMKRVFLGAGNGKHLDFRTSGNTQAMSILNNGKVGIGDTAPTEKLVVSGNAVVKGEGAVFGSYHSLTYNDYWKIWMDGMNSDNGKLHIQVGDNGTETIQFERRNGSSEPVVDMVLKGGNVGIGTETPGATLDVAGSAILSNLKVGPSSQSPGFYLGNKNVSGVDQNNYALVQYNDGATALNAMQGRGVSIMVGGSSKMTFTDAGVQTTENLTVAGVATVGTIKTTNWEVSDAPDYVFEKDYKLASLEKVESFVKKNKHLPEVPSAKQMKKEGLDLVKMNFNLLKKVEELTLYAIEQEKRVKTQEKQNVELARELKELKTSIAALSKKVR